MSKQPEADLELDEAVALLEVAQKRHEELTKELASNDAKIEELHYRLKKLRRTEILTLHVTRERVEVLCKCLATGSHAAGWTGPERQMVGELSNYLKLVLLKTEQSK